MDCEFNQVSGRMSFIWKQIISDTDLTILVDYLRISDQHNRPFDIADWVYY